MSAVARPRPRNPIKFDANITCDNCHREVEYCYFTAEGEGEAIRAARKNVRLTERWAAGWYPFDDICSVCIGQKGGEA